MSQLLMNEWDKIRLKKSFWGYFIAIGVCVIAYALITNSLMNETGLTQEFIVKDYFSTVGGSLGIINIIVVIAASVSMASEFSDGTIKLLLTRPFKRNKILLSKYIICILFGLLTTVFTFVLSSIVGIIIFGTSYLTAEMLLLSLTACATNFCLVIFYVTISLMISSSFRSQAVAVASGIGMVFVSMILQSLLPILISKFEFLKWTIFNGLNINMLSTVSMFNGETPTTIPGELGLLPAIAIIAVHVVLIYFLANLIFKKRDVALT